MLASYVILWAILDNDCLYVVNIPSHAVSFLILEKYRCDWTILSIGACGRSHCLPYTRNLTRLSSGTYNIASFMISIAVRSEIDTPDYLGRSADSFDA